VSGQVNNSGLKSTIGNKKVTIKRGLKSLLFFRKQEEKLIKHNRKLLADGEVVDEKVDKMDTDSNFCLSNDFFITKIRI